MIGIIHIAPCPTDLQTPNRGPTQLANDHQFISSLAHGSPAHRPILPYRLTGSPTHWLTGSPAHWPLATGHRPPTTHHRPPAHLLTGSPATGHLLTCSPATGHRPPAHRLTGRRPTTGHGADHRPPATGHRPPAGHRPAR